jgi:hyperosmotically inducible protein
MRLFAVILLLSTLLTPLFSADKTLSDDAVYDQIQLKLSGDPEVGARDIKIVVKDGAVTLTGKVRNDSQKDKAAKIVKKVKGVRSVDNKLVVTQE